MRRRLLFSLVLVALMVAALPAAAGDRGFDRDAYEYGFFYGTFDESPNTTMFVGGPIESFCGADPGNLHSKVRVADDGTVHVKAIGWNQPIYLYETDANDIPTWLWAPGGLCETGAFPELFAHGRALVRAKDTVRTDGIVDVYNATTGWAVGTDGTRYRVQATADLEIGESGPIGDPRDIVGFTIRTVGR